jgi:spermidine synthase
MALAPECCDLLLVDAFHDEAPAVHLAGERFYAAAFASLASPGVMVANLMSDDPRLDERLQAIEGAFRGAVVCMPALSDPNVIAFGLKGYPPRIAWNELRRRAAELKRGLDLPLADCVNALRSMNVCTAADLVVAGRA